MQSLLCIQQLKASTQMYVRICVCYQGNSQSLVECAMLLRTERVIRMLTLSMMPMGFLGSTIPVIYRLSGAEVAIHYS